MHFESQPEHSGNSFLRKKFKQLPVFFPVQYKNSNAFGTVREYKLNVGQRIFMTFKDQRGSKLGMVIRVLTKLAIIVNTAAYVWSWSPVNMISPSSCAEPVCDSDPALCPGSMVCEPHLDVRMLNIQIMCMFVLLANFTIPTLFCWSVPARLAGVLDLTHEALKAEEEAAGGFADNEEDAQKTLRKRSNSAARQVTQYFGIADGTSGLSFQDIDKMEDKITEDPKYPVFKQVCRYTTTGRSLRAIIGNVPLFMVFLTVSDMTGSGLLVYIARMTPLVQLVDFISGKKSSQVTRLTLARAYPTMLFMIWCIFLLAVVVGAIVFLLERGEFTVTEDFPDGAFLRPTVTGRGKEESPFTSMALSLYWVVVTVTSVGYGEMVCTSAYGRLISVMLMILSIFVLALPIAVIGQILTEEMENYVERKAQKETRVAQQIGVDKSSDLLKKYSSTIERRKSQFNFDLPNELKRATEKRQSMLAKVKSANDVLHRSAPPEQPRVMSVPKRPTPHFSAGSIEVQANKQKSSTSKLFNSWSEMDDEDDDDDNHNDHDQTQDESGVVVLWSSSPQQSPKGSPPQSSVSFSSGNKSKSKAEVKWDDSNRDKEKSEHSPRVQLLNTLSPHNSKHISKHSSSKESAKNSTPRPAPARKGHSESSLVSSKHKSRGARGVGRSAYSRTQEIDRELRALESKYQKQMHLCTELHNQIVSLMNEKNNALNEALL